jgi:hypothetical protein
MKKILGTYFSIPALRSFTSPKRMVKSVNDMATQDRIARNNEIRMILFLDNKN